MVPVEAIQDVFSFWACSGFGQVNGFVVLPKPFLAQEGVRSHFGSSASAGLRRPQEAPGGPSRPQEPPGMWTETLPLAAAE